MGAFPNRTIKEMTMNKKIKTEAVEHLFDAILCLQSKRGMLQLFLKICVPSMNCSPFHSGLK